MSDPVLITGMHRAGTSMVARAASELGLWLGHPDDLVPAAPDNPDGFFEHAGLVAASDALFQQLGAGWDCPPVLKPDDLGRAGLDTGRELARPVLADLAAHGRWAWKDPRAATVLAFWADLVPGLGVVLCLRNPLEVAASLRARNGLSLALGLQLWSTQMAAAASSPLRRLVTHYDAWFHRPEHEVARLAEFTQLVPDDDRVAMAVAVPARHHRHARFDLPALRTARVHPGLRQLYERLLTEADWSDGGAPAGPSPEPSVASEPDDRVGLGQVRPWVVDVGVARFEVHKRNGRVAQLERRLAEIGPPAVPPGDGATDRLEDLQSGVYDLQLSLAELAARVVNGFDTETRARDVGYARMIRAVRADVRRLVARTDEVLVLSDGEPALVDLHGRPARHFPVGPTPTMPGPRPATGAEAVAHLVARRALGARHLIVPAAAAWWLDAYPELADHLARWASPCSRHDDGTALFTLRPPGEPVRFATVAAALVAARRIHGEQVSVLDVTADGLGDARSFRPPEAGAELPYLDTSIDLVVLDASAPAPLRLAAQRVAVLGVLVDDAEGWAWSWTGRSTPVHADIVVEVADVPAPEAYLEVLLAGLPTGHRGQLVLRVAGGTADRWAGVRRDRVTVTTASRREVLGEVLAGADGADHVVLLDGSAVPLEGWLPAVLAPFARGHRVGVVAGRRRMAAGAPIHAAAALVGDGLQATDGAGGDHLVRPIDVAVPGIAAWRRPVLAAHPLDDGYRTLAFALADHCWALAAAGLECLVQPDADVVDLGLGSPPPEWSAADRGHFDAAWASVS